MSSTNDPEPPPDPRNPTTEISDHHSMTSERSKASSISQQSEHQVLDLRMDVFIASVDQNINLYQKVCDIVDGIHKIDPTCALMSIDGTQELSADNIQKLDTQFDDFCKFSVRRTFVGQRVTSVFRLNSTKTLTQLKRDPALYQKLRNEKIWLSHNEFEEQARLANIGFFSGKGTRVTHLGNYASDIMTTIAEDVLGRSSAILPHIQLVVTKLYAGGESAPILEVRCHPKHAEFLKKTLIQYPKQATFGGICTLHFLSRPQRIVPQSDSHTELLAQQLVCDTDERHSLGDHGGCYPSRHYQPTQ